MNLHEIPPIGRLPMLILGMICLLTAVLGGLARLAIDVPSFAQYQAGAHGALMIAVLYRLGWRGLESARLRAGRNACAGGAGAGTSAFRVADGHGGRRRTGGEGDLFDRCAEGGLKKRIGLESSIHAVLAA